MFVFFFADLELIITSGMTKELGIKKQFSEAIYALIQKVFAQEAEIRGVVQTLSLLLCYLRIGV